MIRVRPGDRNWLGYLLKEDCWVDPGGIVHTRYPGPLSEGRWCYNDNPWHGLDESEHAIKIKHWQNRPPGRE